MAEAPKFELPAIVRERLQAAGASTPHPEPDMLAAFSERTLMEEEREKILAHLSGCDRCREVLAVITPEEGPPRVAAQNVVERAGFSWRTLRWGALAAAIALVAVLTIPRLERAKPSQTAAVRPFSEDVPPQPQATPPETGSKLQAGKTSEIPTRLSAPESVAGKEPGTVASRLDHFKAQAKTATSGNVPAFFDKNKVAKAETDADFGVGRGTGVGPGFGGVISGAPYVTKSAAAPAPSTPAVEPNAAANYTAPNNLEIQSAAPTVNNKTTSTASAADEESAKKDQAEAAHEKAYSPARGGALRNPENQLAILMAVPWRLRNGKVEHLAPENGWQPVDLGHGAEFTALFAAGHDIWAGAQGLVVYHSSNGGLNWTKSQIQPALNNVKNGRITKIDFSDPQHGQLFVRGASADGTQADDLWISNDGGKTWLYETID